MTFSIPCNEEATIFGFFALVIHREDGLKVLIPLRRVIESAFLDPSVEVRRGDPVRGIEDRVVFPKHPYLCVLIRYAGAAEGDRIRRKCFGL